MSFPVLKLELHEWWYRTSAAGRSMILLIWPATALPQQSFLELAVRWIPLCSRNVWTIDIPTAMDIGDKINVPESVPLKVKGFSWKSEFYWGMTTLIGLHCIAFSKLTPDLFFLNSFAHFQWLFSRHWTTPDHNDSAP